MTVKERKEREKEEKRSLILQTANEIVGEEGFEKLSIRKIAERIEYSPAIIYHYFQDKEDLINFIIQTKYQKIIGSFSSILTSTENPVEKIRGMARKYIEAALQMPEEYKAIMINSSPKILAYTSVLFKDASLQRPAIGMMCKCLKEILCDADDDLIELTAQVLWSSTFGLIVRLIIENNLDDQQKNKLIEHHLNITIDSMLLGKPII
ncbi:MAG: TetR/AcrR family transcriptional regulator [Bacillota bacterium]|nr:TetR/AcrR family transcriptional regulator [Bacillota bacterium]